MNFLPQLKSNIPQFYYLLNSDDKLQYETIKKSQKEGQKKTDINFANDIENLKKFIIRGNEDDWKRGIVCGIYWLPENKGIAVNIQQLKIILNKSKSSLNASLSRIGLDVVFTRGKAINLILNTFPLLKSLTSEVKQWTIRKLAKISPPSSPIQSNLPQPVEYEQNRLNTQSNSDNKEFEFDYSQTEECNQCNEIFFLCFC